MSKPKSIQENIKFVESPDVSRCMAQLVQIIARPTNVASGKVMTDKKGA